MASTIPFTESGSSSGAGTVSSPAPAPAHVVTLAPSPADGAPASTQATASAGTQQPTAALTRNKSQRTSRNSSKDAPATATKKDTKDSNRTPRKDRNVNKVVDKADTLASPTQPATKQGPSKRRGSKTHPKNMTQFVDVDGTSAAGTAASSSLDPPANSISTPDQSTLKRQQQTSDGAKRSAGRHPKKQHPTKVPGESFSADAPHDSAEPTSEGIAFGVSSSSSSLTPKRSEKLSSSTSFNNINSNNSNDRKKSTPSTNSGQGKLKSNHLKEPTAVDADARAATDNIINSAAKSAETGATSTKPKKSIPTTKDSAAGAGKRPARGEAENNGSRQSNRVNGTRLDSSSKAKDKDKGRGTKDNKDKEHVEDSTKTQSSSRDVRPSSISSSCSFVTSSSSLSPTSPTSCSSSSSSPSSPLGPSSVSFSPLSVGHDNLSAASPGAAASGAAATLPARESRANGRSGRNEKLTSIRTNVSRDGSSPFSAPLSGSTGYSQSSSLTSASPSSRRSSTLTPLGANFGRLGGLPTVEEGSSERHSSTVGESSSNGQPVKRGHTRSLSMKDQLAQLTLESGKEGKTIESLQEIISSLKNLPPSTPGQGSAGDHGTIRHEKRLSMSSLSSRNSIGPLSAGATSTTLHISQPPRGTTIENALQTTVATLRRLSVSDSKRPLLPLKEDEAETSAKTNEKSGNRRSVAFSKEFTPAAGDSSVDTRRVSAAAGYQPNRRSVIIRPEEVAALQEGRSYHPPAFSFSSDDEPDAVADALSALEGKGPASNRSSYSAKGAQRPGSSVDAGSLADFAARLPNHMKGVGAAALVNNDDAHDRRRFTTAFQSSALGSNRASTLASAGAASASSKRLSTMSSTRDSDRKDWRMSTPTGHSNRDSINFKESANGRRPLFTAHLTYSDFHTLLTKQKNKFVQGVLRINKRNRSDAYVTVDTLPEGDVYICGSKDRNRALEGDVVGIELINAEELPQLKTEGSKDKKKGRRGEDAEETAEADMDGVKPKYCGRVVSIVERSISQMFSGTLTLQRPSGSAKKIERKGKDEEDQKDQPRIVWFKPTDKRVPLIAIPIDQAPADFIENHSAYTHKLFVATIKRWPLSSLHPFGQLERELGDIGNIEIETEALLADNNVTTTAFGEKVEKCLPELPWVIPEKELSRRRDLRQDCIFTIDPATAKDLDDAVSCTRLEDGMLEIGVHIADVSHFIKAGSALDREAKSRATTVYLVQKAIPMLPNILCEDLCSLTSNVDRLAFSVFWKMTEEGDILETSFSKSVIRSCAQLSYDDAQRVITTGSLDPKVEVVGQPRTLVEDNIKIFFKLSQILRQKRFENGSLSINSIKLSFETDEIHNPLDVSVYELKESNRLIEEFMLLANMSVAKQICEFFPEQALLRRHEDPLEKRMDDFISHMSKIGLDLDASSSGALQRSLDAIQDPDVRKVVRLLVIKPMQRAKYICSGMLNPDKYHHYALNAPLYTHFTSPIRRYADIIVHRMLEASLVGDSKFYLTKESCQKSANHCNIKKDAAKLAQEQSSHVYLSVLLRNMTESKGMVIRDAIVVQVLDAAFDILIPEYGLEKRVYVDQLPLERHSWNGSTETLKLFWTTDAFKQAASGDPSAESNGHGYEKNRRLSSLPAAMDHPDDATNAYDDERGLFDDESDYEDEETGLSGSHETAAEDENEEDEGEDELRRLTRVRMFGHVNVLVTADTTVSPPVIKVVAMNPYASGDASDVASVFA